MASYKTPPTLNSSLQQEINSMVSVFAANSTAIAEKITYKGLEASGVKNTKVSLPPLMQLINTLIIPTMHFWEGGWGDHPNDSGGATMRGVILNTLNSLFNSVFVDTDIPQVKTAAQAWNANHPDWRNDPQLGKQLLYLLAGNERVGGLFIYKFLASGSNRYPIAVMTEDPYLGFFFAQCVWGSGAGVYGSSYANFDGLLRGYGWDGRASSWASFINDLGDKTPEIASQAILYRYNHIMRISREGTKNSVFQVGWLRRLLNDSRSDLMMLVAINENFNLNSNGAFQLSQSELAHLSRKAQIYQKLSLELPA